MPFCSHKDLTSLKSTVKEARESKLGAIIAGIIDNK